MKPPNTVAGDRERITKQYEEMQKSQALLQIPILESMGYTVVAPPADVTPELA